MLAPWKKSYGKPRQHIEKQRHHFANKGPYCQSYDFSSSHVWMLFCACVLNQVWLFETPWTIALQAPLSKEFSKQEYWSGLPFSTPGHLPAPGIELLSLASPALAGGFFTHCATWGSNYGNTQPSVILMISNNDLFVSGLTYL